MEMIKTKDGRTYLVSMDKNKFHLYPHDTCLHVYMTQKIYENFKKGIFDPPDPSTFVPGKYIISLDVVSELMKKRIL